MRLQKISVGNLFDRFSYEISLNFDPRITILISPNGYGKTMILRIIDAFFNRSPRALTNFPFRELRLDFDNESTVSVLKKEQEKNQKSSGAKMDLEITYIEQGKPAVDFVPKQQANPERLDFPIGIIEELIPELDQLEAQSWRHRGTGEICQATVRGLPTVHIHRGARGIIEYRGGAKGETQENEGSIKDVCRSAGRSR